MAAANLRKRKRESPLPTLPPCEGDTIAVTPRRTVTSQVSGERAPLRETQRGNEVPQLRTASRIEIAKTHTLDEAVPDVPCHTEHADQVVPPDCCLFCRTRGGNAAYECFKEEGEDRCTRCIRDKKNRCRLPTDGEVAAIEARCPQCTRRGFKTCDGGDPCDTCMRNKTGHLCHKQPEKKVKRDDPPTRSTPSTQSKETTLRPSGTRASRRNKVIEPSQNLPFKQPTIAHDADALLATGVEGLPTIPCTPIPQADSDLEVSCNDEDMVIAKETEAHNGDTETQCKAARPSTPPIDGRSRRPLPRISYAGQLVDDDADQDMTLEDDDESDIFSPPETDEESEMEMEPLPSEVESPTDSDTESVDASLLADAIIVEDDELTATTKKPSKKKQTTAEEAPGRTGKGINLGLPPLSNIEECMADMTARAVDLGLCKALRSLGSRHLKVATMCSGTESPLIALDEISRALEKDGYPSIPFQHEFSAEIEVFKQAFIERNFHPKLLFRDVRDFIQEPSTTAITAYGAEADIPTGIDILIAGFVCKDLSRMNNKGKTLKDGGESGDTWLAVHTYARRFRPSIVLLENVKSENATWQGVVSQWDSIGYEAAWVICDSKNYYLPQTRLRMYMIAVNRDRFGKGATVAVGEWEDLMRKLERQVSSPYEAFLPESLKESSSYSMLKTEPDWALCKLRNDHMRSEQRLGILSPISRRSGNGTVMPPVFADRRFYASQSTRVHDAIDVAHLEAAQKGYDSLYKMALWDVSQNADRFRTELGIAPCITPGGQDFATNRQHALNGSQLLLLQGMPLSRLLIANETQKDLHNLAGNAMSTTVIGASLISALVGGHKALRSHTLASTQTSPAQNVDGPSDRMASRPGSLQHTLLEPSTYENLDLAELREDAKLSARMCSCESNTVTSKAMIRSCSVCGHTACTSCAGNPKHVYGKAIPRSSQTQTPDEFIKRWRSRLPARLKFDSFPDVLSLATSMQASDPVLSSLSKVMKAAKLSSQYLCIGDFVRHHDAWKVTYSSPNASLDLQLGQNTQWLLFFKCPPNVPGNSPLRDVLKSPIAQGEVTDSLLDVKWKLQVPCNKAHQLHVSGSSEKSSSWRNRLGLVDYKDETVPMVIRFQSDEQGLEAITGDYQHLPHCGTASNSLYKRSTGEDSMFLFLDPHLIGRPDHDGFVFSHDHSRKHYGESRISLARLESSWRPWHVDDECVHDVSATLSGVWVSATMQLESACVALDVNYLKEGSFGEHVLQDCLQPLTVLDVSMRGGSPLESFSDYSWALERPRSLPSCSSWQSVRSNTLKNCSCAPQYPRMLWSVNEKGVATAHEDRRAAATFERAQKTRPPVFHVKTWSDSTTTRIQVGINVMSIVHRARGRFTDSQKISTAWRLRTDHADAAAQPFAKFRLLSNLQDASQVKTTAPAYLRGTQLQSMSWMAAQEDGKDITVTETEEEVHAPLGWCVEARAQTTFTIRGGVLADHPSFGKTVTTIALIESEFKQYTPKELINQNRTLAAKFSVLLDSAATLIVCPPHIAQQWKSEFEKFLDVRQRELYKILLIEDYDQLECLTFEDVLESRVVIVSWSLFAEDEYVAALADFTAMPEPSLTSRRAFDSWMSHTMESLPSQLAAHQTQPYQSFRQHTDKLLDERLQQAEFKAVVPLKIHHGSAYQSFNVTQSTSKATKSSQAKNKPASKPKAKESRRTAAVPLLHLFRFNRLVVDEYHYLDDSKATKNNMAAVSIKKVASHKRWVLSGTPALTNFSDVDEIATFLGVKLGRDFFGDGMVTTSTEKVRRNDQTDVENFLSQTEVMSRQWHQARRDQAQDFLDVFVRQNEAELQHIFCSEELLPIHLDAAHHAVYLELSQHLISQRMQIKKTNKKSSSDRNNRLNDSLDGSASAEEALLKSALLFETEDGKSGIELLMTRRSEQLKSTENELFRLLAGFEGLMIIERRKRPDEKKTSNDPGITELYGHFKEDIAQSNWLGDEETSQCLRDLLTKAAKSPKSGFPELAQASEAQRLLLTKQRLSNLREVALEYAHRARSKRFIDSIYRHLQSPASNVRSLSCSSSGCHSMNSLDELHSIPHCGHTACSKCLEARLDDETCVDPGCNSLATDSSLIRLSDLDLGKDHNMRGTFGNKLETVIQLVQKLPVNDQAIVFAPNEEIIGILETILDHYGISYHSPSRSKRTSSKVMEDFKTNRDLKTRKQLLILNLGSESAAGVNLTNANHIVFVAPLLSKTQYEYESAMAQAIARSRRYGQKKKVHIYHVVAQRTIDVDILEHRHRRNDGITTANSKTTLLKPSSKRKERTKLIRSRKGEMVLVPSSWLEEKAKRRMLDIEETPASFTSLINLSETFEQFDDE